MLEVGEVGIDDGRRYAVDRKSALLPARRIPVEVTTIDDKVARHDFQGRLRAGSKLDERRIHGRRRPELEQLEPPVVGSRSGPKRRLAVRRADRRENRVAGGRFGNRGGNAMPGGSPAL